MEGFGFDVLEGLDLSLEVELGLSEEVLLGFEDVDLNCAVVSVVSRLPGFGLICLEVALKKSFQQQGVGVWVNFQMFGEDLNYYDCLFGANFLNPLHLDNWSHYYHLDNLSHFYTV